MKKVILTLLVAGLLSASLLSKNASAGYYDDYSSYYGHDPSSSASSYYPYDYSYGYGSSYYPSYGSYYYPISSNYSSYNYPYYNDSYNNYDNYSNGWFNDYFADNYDGYYSNGWDPYYQPYDYGWNNSWNNNNYDYRWDDNGPMYVWNNNSQAILPWNDYQSYFDNNRLYDYYPAINRQRPQVIVIKIIQIIDKDDLRRNLVINNSNVNANINQARIVINHAAFTDLQDRIRQYPNMGIGLSPSSSISFNSPIGNIVDDNAAVYLSRY